MSAKLLDGTTLAKQYRANLKTEVADYEAEYDETPSLAVMRVGGDESAAAYARAIEKSCRSVGIAFREVVLGKNADQDEVESALELLNADFGVHGIMILEPLPAHIEMAPLIEMLDPSKDVDGVHPVNAGMLMRSMDANLVPATPAAAIALLEDAKVKFAGLHAVVVGRSEIVGKPMAMLLLHRHCTVTIAHSRTRNLADLCRSADILCLAMGRPEMVKGDWVKPGAIVVDFGTTYTNNGVKGDCDQEEVREVARLLTPVPGGVGPMTNVMLLKNVLVTAILSQTINEMMYETMGDWDEEEGDDDDNDDDDTGDEGVMAEDDVEELDLSGLSPEEMMAKLLDHLQRNSGKPGFPKMKPKDK